MTSSPNSTIERENPGDRAVRFINKLTLCDDFAGRPFVTRPWQDGIIRKLIGTLTAEGKRRYRKALLMLPRKQAKTQLSAALALYFAAGEGKRGQQVVVAASDRDQASNLFDKCVSMIEADPALDRRFRIYSSKKRIVHRKGGNEIRVISADGRRQHGLNPSVVILDELHTQPDRRLYAALATAQSTREEALFLMISTAGNDRDSLCYDRYKYALKCQADPDFDPSFCAILYGADESDDWRDEATWHKAMPALGDFAPVQFFRDELREALESPSKESEFKQLYLNLWVASARKWLNRQRWDLCGKAKFAPAELVGRDCYAGLDLSEVADPSSLVLVFPMDDGTYRVVPYFWLPADVAPIRDRKSLGATRFAHWSRQGYVTLTPGDTIDHDAIKLAILGDESRGIYGIRDRFNIVKMRIDRMSASQIALQLSNAGLDVEFMRQGCLSMNEPVRRLEVLISKGLMHHGDNPVMNWMADNAVSVSDSEGNVRLSKKQSADKIDGVVSLVMGLAAAMADDPVKPGITILGRDDEDDDDDDRADDDDQADDDEDDENRPY